MPLAKPDDLVLFVSPDRKRFVVRLQPGETFHTHRGMIPHDDVIGAPLGQSVRSHNGSRFTVMRPDMDELYRTLPRNSQIVYPKEIGYILMKLAVFPGVRVVEAGSGSGVLTCALARYVTPGGHVYSYDARPDMLELAQANVGRVGLADSVTFQQRSIEAGFDERDADALFLDVREPWLYLDQAIEAMADGAFFGALVPTLNQVVSLVSGLSRRAFSDLDVSEILMRKYKAVPERVRPLDRLTAHTGFMIFARKSSAALEQPASDEAREVDADPPPAPSPHGDEIDDVDYITDIPGLAEDLSQE